MTAENIRQSVKSLETNTQNKLDSKLSTAEFDVRASGIRQEIINATKDKADKALVTAEAGRLREELASLQVGGRNLLKGSKGPFKPNRNPANFDNNVLYHNETSIYMVNGQRYRISAKTDGIFASHHDGFKESDNIVLWIMDKAVANYQIVSDAKTGTTGTDFIWNRPTGTYHLRVNTYRKDPEKLKSVWEVKVEQGSFKTDWSPAPEDTEDLITEAKATFERTAEGQLTTITQQVAGKASQTDFQRVQETSKLYERLIGSTEKEITDKVSRMALTNELFQVEVSKNLGLRTVQYQMANAWAVQNLNSNGDIVSQINMTGPNVRIQGESIHLDGKALIDNGIIKNAMIESMLADKITAGTLNAANVNIINLNASKIVGLDANFIKSKIELAFIEWLKGKTISAQNDAMKIDLNKANITFNRNASIDFNSDNNAIKRIKNGVTAFANFADDEFGGVHAGFGVTSHNVGVNSTNTAKFAGMRVFRSDDKHDFSEVYGDFVYLKHEFKGRNGYYFQPAAATKMHNMTDLINKLEQFAEYPLALGRLGKMQQDVDLIGYFKWLNQRMKHLGNAIGRPDLFYYYPGVGAKE